MIWPKPGPEDTRQTLELAIEAALSRGIGHLVVASSTGATARQALEVGVSMGASGLTIVCVTHHVGFKGPGIDEMSPEERRYLSDRGVRVLTTTHALAGVDRALRFKFGGIYPPEIIAGALRMLGQGLKVCVEISVMALDAGLIPYGQRVVAVAGTGSGADTAAVILPEHSTNIFALKVEEILCKPGTW